MSQESLLSLTVGELLDAVAARTPAPGGGACAALAAALAAALTAMAGRYVDPSALGSANAGRVAGQGNPAEIPDVARVVARAEELRQRVAPLADTDAAAYGRYLEASRLPREPDPEPRRQAVRAALSAASDVPLAVAEVAAEVAELAAGLVRSGNPNLRGDALAATQLAVAAATTAATLVAENLARTSKDPRVERAASLASAARGSAAAAESVQSPG